MGDRGKEDESGLAGGAVGGHGGRRWWRRPWGTRRFPLKKEGGGVEGEGQGARRVSG